MASVPDLADQVYANVQSVSSSALAAQIYINVGTGFPPEVLGGVPVTPPPCHVPHKNWASYQEAENYHAIERWSFIMHDHPFPVPFHLHIPYPNWGDRDEQANYLAIERWALETQTVGYREPLHFPHKRWAFGTQPQPELEEDNYRYLENWSLAFRGYPGEVGEGVPPLYPNLVVQIYENVT
jgi:hypothetical protein